MKRKVVYVVVAWNYLIKDSIPYVYGVYSSAEKAERRWPRHLKDCMFFMVEQEIL